MAQASICAVSHIGNSRGNQEDNFLVCQGRYLPQDMRDHMAHDRIPHRITGKIDKSRFLVAVSDGMGGHACGEVASLMAVEYLSDHYDDVIDAVKLNSDALSLRLSGVNHFVSSVSKNDSSRRGMGATLCGIVSNGYDMVGFNIGDSRLYQWKDGKIRQLSTDHTEGQRLINMHLLTAEEEKKFPRRKMLYKFVGYDGEIVPDVFPIMGTEPGTALLLCTDGLSDVLTAEEMEEILKNRSDIKETAMALAKEAASRNIGHGDNITVILMEF